MSAVTAQSVPLAVSAENATFDVSEPRSPFSRHRRMKAINPYLNFDGNTREAMTFYAKNLGAKLELQSFKDVGMAGPNEDKIMHAKLAVGSLVIMASDPPPGMGIQAGN